MGPVVLAREAEGPQEETITWEHKGSGFTCPQNYLWPRGLLPRRSVTDLSWVSPGGTTLTCHHQQRGVFYV